MNGGPEWGGGKEGGFACDEVSQAPSCSGQAGKDPLHPPHPRCCQPGLGSAALGWEAGGDCAPPLPAFPWEDA